MEATESQKGLFATVHRQQGTTEKQRDAAKERKENTPTDWTRLCEFFQDVSDSGEFSYVLLAAARRTNTMIDEIANTWGIDEWEALVLLRDAEAHVVNDREFTRGFKQFLAEFDLYLESLQLPTREQAVTVQDGYAMTYEEIGAKLGISWQRVQQIEQEALQKLRDTLRLNPELTFEILEWLGMSPETAFRLNEEAA